MKPSPGKARAEASEAVARLMGRILADSLLSSFCALVRGLRPAGPYIVESYVRPLQVTRSLATGRGHTGARRLIRAYLSQFDSLESGSVQSAQLLLSMIAETQELARRSRIVVVHCPSCGELSAVGERLTRGTSCGCSSTPWRLHSIDPTTPMENLLRDDFYLELASSMALRTSAALLSAGFGDLQVTCGIPYRSALRDVELDVVGYDQETVLIVEARTGRLTPNDVTSKRGQIEELFQEVDISRKVDLGSVRLVFVSPIKHDGSIIEQSYAELSSIPVSLLTGPSIDSLEGRLESIMADRR